MIAELKPYAKYRDSGIPLIGRVPSHWDVVPMSRVARQKAELGGTERQLLSVYLNRGVVRFEEVDEKRTNATSDDLSQYQTVSPGDLVLNNQQAWRGSTGVSRHSGIVSPAYFVLRLSSTLGPEYANLLFRDRCMVSQYLVCSKGIGTIQRNLYWPHLKRVGVIVPPAEEQAAIVRFLSWTNGRLERAIRAKRKVIALLNEQRQAIIQTALISRHLIARADSGNPWLGSVPAHWNQRALWTICHPRSERNPGNLPLLSVFLGRGVIRYEEGGGQVHAPSLDLSNYQVVKSGDFVLNNQQAWRGSVGVSPHNGIISPAYIVLELSGELDKEYANYLLRSRLLIDQFVAASKGVGDIQRQVSWPMLRRVQIPIPPMNEQLEIAATLRAATGRQQVAIANLESEIGFIAELRRTIVADVVVGKRDVREVAALLPAEAANASDGEAAEPGLELEPVDEGSAA